MGWSSGVDSRTTKISAEARPPAPARRAGGTARRHATRAARRRGPRRDGRTRTTRPRVRAWAPSSAFRGAVRSATLATLALYVGIVETLANEADRGDGDDGETMH